MSSFLTDHQRQILSIILDRLIPPEGSMPGAAQAGVIDHLEQYASKSQANGRLLLETLAEVEASAGRMHGQAFAELIEQKRDGVLRELEQKHPEPFQTLLRQTYIGYYTRPEVLKRLDYDARPPQPRGHQLKPFDSKLLDRVRRMGPLYKT